MRRAKVASVFGKAVYVDVPTLYTRTYELHVDLVYPDIDTAIRQQFETHLKAAIAAGIACAGGISLITVNPGGTWAGFKAGFLGYFKTNGALATGTVVGILDKCSIRTRNKTGDWR